MKALTHFAALKRRFSNRPNLIQTGAGTTQLPFTSLDPHWIVGRGLCMYRRESFAHVPKPKRDAALAHQVPVWSPFRETGHFCVWSAGDAMVWFWDAESVAAAQGEALPEAGIDEQRRWVTLPESVFLPRRSTGAYLLACQGGFELQVWREEVLTDSFWFPEAPDAEQIGAFLDRRGLGGEAVRRDDGGMTAEPWSTRVTPREWMILNEPRLVAACLLVLSAAFVWQEVRYWNLIARTSSLAADIAELDDEIRPLLRARNETQRLRDVNRRLSAIVSAPSQALLMGLVDESLPSGAAKFKEWHYQQGELRIVVEDPDMNPIDYVRKLEAQPMFGRVAAEQARGTNRIEVTMTVQS